MIGWLSRLVGSICVLNQPEGVGDAGSSFLCVCFVRCFIRILVGHDDGGGGL